MHPKSIICVAQHATPAERAVKKKQSSDFHGRSPSTACTMCAVKLKCKVCKQEKTRDAFPRSQMKHQKIQPETVTCVAERATLAESAQRKNTFFSSRVLHPHAPCVPKCSHTRSAKNAWSVRLFQGVNSSTKEIQNEPDTCVAQHVTLATRAQQ